MKPSMCRTVVYHQPAAEEPCNGHRDHPAIVTSVWGNDIVNVKVLFDCGDTEDRTSVNHASNLTERQKAEMGYWEWPPREPDEAERTFRSLAPDAAA